MTNRIEFSNDYQKQFPKAVKKGLIKIGNVGLFGKNK